MVGISLATLNAGELAKSKDPKKDNPTREEKVEILLTDLQKRCKKMLDLKITVHKATKSLHKTVEGTSDKKPRPEDRKAALKLADDIKKIIAEVNAAVAILEKEGSAVAFPEVFRQVRDDMKIVQTRLEKCDLGKKTQELQQDIIDTLREMTAALEKK